MKTSSQPFIDTLQKEYNIAASLRVIGEWNQNRYTDITTVDVNGSPEADNGYDLDLFPIESITKPIRPTAGLIKARIGEAFIGDDSDNPDNPRYYLADEDDLYKYWTSQTQSTSTVSGTGFAIANCKPYIVYANQVWANKIYICFENTLNNPADWNIQITTDGSTWTTVASNIAPDAQGRVVLYRQADNSWATTVYRDNPVGTLMGVRLLITSTTLATTFLNLIELGLRLETDLTQFVSGFSVENSMSETDVVSPFGSISSNAGNLTLDNSDGRFNNDPPVGDTLPMFRGLIDANVKFTIDFAIDTTPQGGSGLEFVRMATMYADGAWQGNEHQVSIPLKDSSKFLQEMKPLDALIENASIGQAIWRIMEMGGFTNYQYSSSAENFSTDTRFFWTMPDDTMWDNIQQICRTTQSVAWFDEYDVLQIKARDKAFRLNVISPDWALHSTTTGEVLPDIKMDGLEKGSEFQLNDVIIHYRPTGLAKDVQGRPVTQELWRPDGDIVLRSSQLIRSMDSTQMNFWLSPDDAAIWPYSGIVNIHGELIKFDGKAYKYYPSATPSTPAYKIIKSFDEKKHVDTVLTAPSKIANNAFTGRFVITERGFDYTEGQAHSIDIDGWRNAGAFKGLGSPTQWNGGLKLIRDQSILRLQTNKTFTNGRWYAAYRTVGTDTTTKYFGTRLKFPKSPSGNTSTAGLFWWGNSARTTFYAVKVSTTHYIDGGDRRKTRNEVSLCKRNADGSDTLIGGKGHAMRIADDIWVDIDVVMNTDGNIDVYANGLRVIHANDTSLASTGRCGLFTRGFTVADFEYFYGAGPNSLTETDLDNQSFMDIINSGYYSNQYYKDIKWGTRTVHKRRGRKTTTVKQNYRSRVLEEFGFWVHEVREFDVRFEDKMAVWHDLYMSNDQQAVLDEYIIEPTGAKFRIANASRYNAVINGEDTITFGIFNPIQQAMLIYGRTIQQADDKTYTVKDDQAILAHGDIQLEIESDWLQSEGAAKDLGNWIVDNWATPADELTVQTYGNPLLQIGDIVSIQFPQAGMTTSTHKYYVVGVNNEWNSGLDTTLNLRRAHN